MQNLGLEIMKKIIVLALLAICSLASIQAYRRTTGRRAGVGTGVDVYPPDRYPYSAIGGQCGYMSPLATPADLVECRDMQLGFKNRNFPLWACD